MRPHCQQPRGRLRSSLGKLQVSQLPQHGHLVVADLSRLDLALRRPVQNLAEGQVHPISRRVQPTEQIVIGALPTGLRHGERAAVEVGGIRNHGVRRRRGPLQEPRLESASGVLAMPRGVSEYVRPERIQSLAFPTRDSCAPSHDYRTRHPGLPVRAEIRQ